MNRRFLYNSNVYWAGIFACTLIAAWTVSAQTQYQPYGPKQPYQPYGPANYRDYYMQHVENYNRPPTNVRNYTIDKYYLQNPNVSPYSMLTRHNPYGNNYYQYTLPEQQRRAEMNAPRPEPIFTASTPVPSTASTDPVHNAAPPPPNTGVTTGKTNPYFNKYYQGWNAAR